MAKKINNEESETLPLVAPKYTKYKRNEAGLLENVKYKFNEDGSVNWRGMVKPEYIVLNRDKKSAIENKYNQTLEELQNKIQTKQIDETDIDDSYKLLLLAGIKDLARLRGYTYVNHEVRTNDAQYVAVKTTIRWVKNYETNNEMVEFSSLADAHVGNTKSFAANFLNTIAENRGFVRCVRNSLGIHIVGSDELGNTVPEESGVTETRHSPTSPNAALIRKVEELKDRFAVSWATLQKYLVSDKSKERNEQIEEAKEWNSVEDVPSDKCYDLLGIIDNIIKRKSSEIERSND